jgi:hypothetical protein
MPYKFNEDRRHKQKFKVTNCAAYNESLRQRGDMTVWISDEALSQWSAARRTSRGGQPKYSDLAITICLTLRICFWITTASNSRSDAQYRDADGRCNCRAGFLHAVTPEQGADFAALSPCFTEVGRSASNELRPQTAWAMTCGGKRWFL